MASDISVRFSNRVRIDELSAVSAVNPTTDYINISDTEVSVSKKFQISNFSSNNDAVNNAAVDRYSTPSNDLNIHDLTLFSSENEYKQSLDSDKETYFEKHPIVDYHTDVSVLQEQSLITKTNLNEFEHYLSTRDRFPCMAIPAYNWENEEDKLNKLFVTTDISDFIPTTANESRATYKIPYNSHVSNIVKLNSFRKEGAQNTLKGTAYYSVAGVVSVKSILPDQRSGTIYLEARPEGSSTDWHTVDSAVFKFVDNTEVSSSPGTYVVLNGYLTTDFETRLRLNLDPQGYSMNLHDYRLTEDALVTNHVNTFIGFAYFPANTDEEWEVPDYSQYYNIVYWFPGSKLSALDDVKNHLNAWPLNEKPSYVDVDCDAGPNQLDGSRPKTDKVTWETPNAPPQYRHMRWVDVTPGYSVHQPPEYEPEEFATLTSANCHLNVTDNIYEFWVEALYEQIYYKIFYKPGIAKWPVEVDRKKPQYNYTIHGQHETPPLELGNDYYRHLCWKDRTHSNKIVRFGAKIDLTDETTKPAPGTTDPRVERQIILDAHYVPIRYYVKYYPGEAADAKTGSWTAEVDTNSGAGYKYNKHYELYGRRPVQTSSYNNKAGRILLRNNQIKIHYAWKIKTYSGNDELFLPNQKIYLTDELINRAQYTAYMEHEPIYEDPWEISAVAQYMPPYRIVVTTDGGYWYDWSNDVPGLPSQWNNEHGNIPFGGKRDITISQPVIRHDENNDHDYFTLPGIIAKKGVVPNYAWNVRYTTYTYQLHAQNAIPIEIDITNLGSEDTYGIRTIYLDAVYENIENGITYSPVNNGTYLKNLKPYQTGEGSCGSWTYDNYPGTPYWFGVTLNNYKSLILSTPSSPVYLDIRNYVGSYVNASLAFVASGCHHEDADHRTINIHLDDCGSWNIRAPSSGWYDGHRPAPSSYTFRTSMRLYRNGTYNGNPFFGTRQLWWNNNHHLYGPLYITNITI